MHKYPTIITKSLHVIFLAIFTLCNKLSVIICTLIFVHHETFGLCKQIARNKNCAKVRGVYFAENFADKKFLSPVLVFA